MQLICIYPVMSKDQVQIEKDQVPSAEINACAQWMIYTATSREEGSGHIDSIRIRFPEYRLPLFVPER